MKYLKIFESFSENEIKAYDIIKSFDDKRKDINDKIIIHRSELSRLKSENDEISKTIKDKIHNIELEYLDEIDQIMVDIEDIPNIKKVNINYSPLCSYFYKPKKADISRLKDIIHKLDNIIGKKGYQLQYRNSSTGSTTLDKIIKGASEDFEIVFKFNKIK